MLPAVESLGAVGVGVDEVGVAAGLLKNPASNGFVVVVGVGVVVVSAGFGGRLPKRPPAGAGVDPEDLVRSVEPIVKEKCSPVLGAAVVLGWAKTTERMR